jgi:hypothetical protein
MIMKEPTYPPNLGIHPPYNTLVAIRDVSWVREVKLRHGNKHTSPSSELNESVHRPDRCKNWELLVLELKIHPLEEVVAFPIAGMHRGTCDRIGKNIRQIALRAVRAVLLFQISFLFVPIFFFYLSLLVIFFKFHSFRLSYFNSPLHPPIQRNLFPVFLYCRL